MEQRCCRLRRNDDALSLFLLLTTDGRGGGGGILGDVALEDGMAIPSLLDDNDELLLLVLLLLVLLPCMGRCGGLFDNFFDAFDFGGRASFGDDTSMSMERRRRWLRGGGGGGGFRCESLLLDETETLANVAVDDDLSKLQLDSNFLRGLVAKASACLVGFGASPLWWSQFSSP